MSTTSTSTTAITFVETTFSYIIPEVTDHISCGTIPGNHIGTASFVSFSHPQLQTFFPYYLSEVTRPITKSRIVEVEFANFSVPGRKRRKEKRRKQGWKKGRKKEGKKEIHRESQFSYTPVFRKYELQWN